VEVGVLARKGAHLVSLHERDGIVGCSSGL
jgi:hypothetical protein